MVIRLSCRSGRHTVRICIRTKVEWLPQSARVCPCNWKHLLTSSLVTEIEGSQVTGGHEGSMPHLVLFKCVVSGLQSELVEPLVCRTQDCDISALPLQLLAGIPLPRVCCQLVA